MTMFKWVRTEEYKVRSFSVMILAMNEFNFFVLFNNCISCLGCKDMKMIMNGEFVRMWKESSVVHFKALFCHLH